MFSFLTLYERNHFFSKEKMNTYTAIFFATPSEMRFTKKRLKISSRILGEGFTLYVVDSPHSPLLLVQTGIGPLLAQKAGDYIFKNFPLREVWVFGLCGGAKAHLAPGQPLLANALWNEKKERLLPSPLLIQHIRDFSKKIGQKIEESPFLTVSSVIEDPEEKIKIQKDYGCAAIEMEAFPIAKLSEQYQVPFAELRWVVDPIDFKMPPTASFINAQGTLIFSKLFFSLLKKPSLIPALMKLSKHAQLALQAQNSFLEKFFDFRRQ